MTPGNIVLALYLVYWHIMTQCYLTVEVFYYSIPSHHLTRNLATTQKTDEDDIMKHAAPLFVEFIS